MRPWTHRKGDGDHHTRTKEGFGRLRAGGRLCARLFGTLSQLEQFHSSYAYALDDYLSNALHDALRDASPAQIGETSMQRFERLTHRC